MNVEISRALRAVALAAAASCVLAAGASPARAGDALTVISGASAGGFYDVLTSVAERAGYFKEQNLTVDVQFAGNPFSASQLVATGKADIAAMSINPILQGYEKGLRLQAFFARDPHFDSVLAVLDDSPIHTLADFRGAVLGETSTGGPPEVAANSLLAGAGLKKGDVTYVPIGTGSQGLSAIAGKRVAGAAFPFPELARYEIEGHLKFRYFWHPVLKDIGNAAFSAAPATIQTKGALLERFSRAMVKASILIRENPQLAARYFLTGAGTGGVTPEGLQSEARLLQLTQDQLPGYDPNNPRIGYISPVGIGVLAQFFYDNGLTSGVVPAAAVVTDRFIAYANDFDHKAFAAQVKALR
jgi:NitT/TauT family transport system substrate-binding protein